MKLRRILALFNAIAGRQCCDGRKSRITRGRHGVHLRALAGDERGSIFVLLALGTTVILGFVGLGVDVSYWYAERRATQNIADSAAIAGTYASLQTDGDHTARRRDRGAPSAVVLRADVP
jgi:Flp pilus assembly protein TadG